MRFQPFFVLTRLIAVISAVSITCASQVDAGISVKTDYELRSQISGSAAETPQHSTSVDSLITASTSDGKGTSQTTTTLSAFGGLSGVGGSLSLGTYASGLADSYLRFTAGESAYGQYRGSASALWSDSLVIHNSSGTNPTTVRLEASVDGSLFSENSATAEVFGQLNNATRQSSGRLISDSTLDSNGYLSWVHGTLLQRHRGS